jgi:hypothetical protein
MDWFEAHLWLAWLGLGITLGVLEMFSLDLILLMLAVGSFVGMATALIGLPIAVQVLAAAGGDHQRLVEGTGRPLLAVEVDASRGEGADLAQRRALPADESLVADPELEAMFYGDDG